MTREREKLRFELETAREETIRQLTREKDESTQRYEKEKEDLHYELANAITERDQALIEAENEKQKVEKKKKTKFFSSKNKKYFLFSASFNCPNRT
jgi:hypothetical protein